MSEAQQRGPNYDYAAESQHYQRECEQLRSLIAQMEANGELRQATQDILLGLVKSVAGCDSPIAAWDKVHELREFLTSKGIAVKIISEPSSLRDNPA